MSNFSIKNCLKIVSVATVKKLTVQANTALTAQSMLTCSTTRTEISTGFKINQDTTGKLEVLHQVFPIDDVLHLNILVIIPSIPVNGTLVVA